MLKLEDFNKVSLSNTSSVLGGWKFTGKKEEGHYQDWENKGTVLCSNGDGTYSKCPVA